MIVPNRFNDVWPWPLPPLPAGAVAVWLLTVAAGSWWALREGDWQRVRIAMPAHVIFCLLSLLAALRFRSTLAADDWRAWAFIGALLFSLATFGVAFWLQEQGRRRLVPSERPLA